MTKIWLKKYDLKGSFSFQNRKKLKIKVPT